MKDIPMFTTEFGVASLILREIPYQNTAYIKLHASLQPDLLLQDCVSFCRMVGAEQIYASGDTFLEQYPFYTAVWSMTCSKDSLSDTDAALWPVQEHTVQHFRQIYNEKVSGIPGGAWMTSADEKEIVRSGEGYFIHRDETILGIGWVRDNKMLFLASMQPGAGEDVVRALAHAITDDNVLLEVASENIKALNLYQRLGFIKTGEIVRWYQVL